MEAIILAGGFGTRLAHIVADVPKPMAPVAGKPFLEYVLDDLINQGVKRIIFAVCYKKEIIIDYFGTSYKGAELIYSVEEKPLFTGGAVKLALTKAKEKRVFIINGDTYFQVDLKKMRELSSVRETKLTIAVKQMTNFSRYGSVLVDELGYVRKFNEKAPCEEGLINGGIYDIMTDCLDAFPESFSLEEVAFPDIMLENELISFRSDDYFIDIGIAEDYEKANITFSGGIP